MMSSFFNLIPLVAILSVCEQPVHAIGRRSPPVPSSASSGHSFGHRRMANYSDGLDVVKTDNDGDDRDEYVTSFYRRARERRRAALFGEGGRRDDDDGKSSSCGDGNERLADHSLDHYFDHRLTTSISPSHRRRKRREGEEEEQDSSDGGEGVEYDDSSIPSPSSAAMRRVRGGEAAPRLLAVQRPSSARIRHIAAGDDDEGRDRTGGNNNPSSARRRSHPLFGRMKHHQKKQQQRRSSSSHREGGTTAGNGGHRHDHRDLSSDGPDPQERISYQECYDGVEEEEEEADADDFPDHHLGLLRVPCSIAINSGEASHQHQHHNQFHQAKTPVAAYVDTGAQVTVISASAARRAGILHLMDRRYAGRATGVGHCRVLGRIPARHVYFLLGEGCSGDDDDERRRDYEDERYGGDNRDDYYDRDDDDRWSDSYTGYRGGGDRDHEDDEDAVLMDGPALTVLEGTVTRGVDVLLGLDVLQDWEAEIRVGTGRKSLTVRRRRGGGGGSVVIPFATKDDDARRYRERSSGADARRGHRSRSRYRSARLESTHDHRRHLESKDYASSGMGERGIMDEEEDDVDDDSLFSPVGSDIESDLDLLDRSSCRGYAGGENDIRDDDVVEEEEEEDYLRDIEDDEEDDASADEGEGEIDMSGL